jgi:hypothetical protein
MARSRARSSVLGSNGTAFAGPVAGGGGVGVIAAAPRVSAPAGGGGVGVIAAAPRVSAPAGWRRVGARLAAAEDWVRRTFDRDDLALLLLVLAMWALPLVNTVQTGLYRREAALLPLVLLLRRAPTWLVVGFAAAVVPVWAMMAYKFYWFALI